MPRAPSITEAEVFAAIEATLAAGEYPTSIRLRERLANRGSPVTLQRFLAGWYAKFGAACVAKVEAYRATAADPVRARMAAAAKDALAEFDVEQAKRIAALDEREAIIDQREDDLLHREQALDQRESGQRELIDRLTTEADSAQAVATEAKDAQSRTAAVLQASKEETAKLVGQLKRLEAAATENVRLRQQLASALKTVGAERKKIAQLAESRQAADTLAERLANQLETVQRESEGLRREATENQARIATAAQEMAAARAKLASQSARYQEEGERYAALETQLRGKLAGERSERERVAGELVAMTIGRDVMQSMLEKFRRDHGNLTQELGRQREAIANLTNEIEKMFAKYAVSQESSKPAKPKGPSHE